MELYEYKFVEVSKKLMKKEEAGFKCCENVIKNEAKDGWRLKQVVTPFNHKAGVYVPENYTIIFERKM